MKIRGATAYLAARFLAIISAASPTVLTDSEPRRAGQSREGQALHEAEACWALARPKDRAMDSTL